MTGYEAIKINAKYKNMDRVANNIEHLEKVKNKLIDKSIDFKEHLTHLNVKTKKGTIVYYQTGTVLFKSKKISKNEFWKLIKEDE